jgi:hypothetical protein
MESLTLYNLSMDTSIKLNVLKVLLAMTGHE